MTPEQELEIRRHVSELRQLPAYVAAADALSALLQERETLRAALPTRDQLEALLFVGDAFVEGPFCAACHMPNDLDAGRGQLIPKHKPDCWLAALLTPREDR